MTKDEDNAMTTTKGMLKQACRGCGTATWMLGPHGPLCEGCAPPPLAGSPKQIEWASRLRETFLRDCPADDGAIRAVLNRAYEDLDEALAFAGTTPLGLRAAAASCASASDWIDSRWRWEVRLATMLAAMVQAKRDGAPIKPLSKCSPEPVGFY